MRSLAKVRLQPGDRASLPWLRRHQVRRGSRARAIPLCAKVQPSSSCRARSTRALFLDARMARMEAHRHRAPHPGRHLHHSQKSALRLPRSVAGGMPRAGVAFRRGFPRLLPLQSTAPHHTLQKDAIHHQMSPLQGASQGRGGMGWDGKHLSLMPPEAHDTPIDACRLQRGVR